MFTIYNISFKMVLKSLLRPLFGWKHPTNSEGNSVSNTFFTFMALKFYFCVCGEGHKLFWVSPGISQQILNQFLQILEFLNLRVSYLAASNSLFSISTFVTLQTLGIFFTLYRFYISEYINVCITCIWKLVP